MLAADQDRCFSGRLEAALTLLGKTLELHILYGYSTSRGCCNGLIFRMFVEVMEGEIHATMNIKRNTRTVMN